MAFEGMTGFLFQIIPAAIAFAFALSGFPVPVSGSSGIRMICFGRQYGGRLFIALFVSISRETSITIFSPNLASATEVIIYEPSGR